MPVLDYVASSACVPVIGERNGNLGSEDRPAVVRSDIAIAVGKSWKISDGNGRMRAMVANIREALHTLAEQLPEVAIWKDVAYETCVRQEVEASLDEARRGEFATDDEVKSAFAQ